MDSVLREAFFQSFVREEIARMEEYVPVEPIETLAARYGVPPEQIVKIDANENPYGPSPKALAAIAAARHHHIYPDPVHTELREKLADYTGMPASRILAGNGSDELLDLVARLVLRPGDRIVNCPPTFGMYQVVADWAGAEVIDVPRTPAFNIDLAAVLEAIDDRTKLIFIASPNNPTGTLISRWDLQVLLQQPVIVVVDEAYYEFAQETVLPLALEYPNLVVLRTFSKWAGLAGLRVGYGIFPEWMMPHLWKLEQPYNISTVGLAAAAASLDDREHLLKTVDRIIYDRERLLNELRKISIVSPNQSDANFILCRMRAGSARELWERLRRRGVFIRYFDKPGLEDCIRISVGLPEHVDRVVAEIREYALELGATIE